MPLTDYWELKDNQVQGLKNLLNVWHVKRILAGATAQTIVDAFTFSILTTNFLSMQDNNLARTTIECQNLGDPTDFVNFDSTAFGGTDTGDRFVNFISATIQFNRTRNDMKNGQKRLVMGRDADAADGVWVAPMLTQMDLVKDTVLAPWVTLAAPLVDVCNYVVLKRFCVDPLEDPCQVYRLPNSDAEVDANHYVPLTGISRPRQRSQVSRKVL